MTNIIPTVAEYLVRRIAQLGVTHAFGVPGDYSFPIDNAIEFCPGLDWVLDEAAIAEKSPATG